MTPNQRGLTMTEAGALYGKTRWTVQGWIRQGLPYIPSGKKHKIILTATLEAWLRSRQVTAKGAR